jgi:PAS domain S-box-containing protein
MSEKSQPAAATEPELLHSVIRPRDEPGIPLTSLVPEIAPIFGVAGDPGAGADANLVSQLMDLLPVRVAYVTKELRYGWVNQHYARWFGRSRREIIGKSVREILGEPLFRSILPRAEKALAGEAVRFENTIDSPEGSVRHLDVTYVPRRDPHGAIEGMIVLAYDVSERRNIEDKLRESELRFRQLAENIDEVFWMTSAGGNEVLYVSPAFERIWQRACADLYRQPSLWLAAVHPDDRARVSALYAPESLARGKFNAEYRVVRPDGSVRWVHDRGFPIRDDDGRVLRIAGLAQDVTDLKLAEDRERQLLADLAHMARLTTMGEMASGLAHELNQPLAAITGYVDAAAELLRARGALPDDVRQAMEDAAAEAERAGKIIHRMKGFLHRTEPQQTAIDLNLLIREALDLAARDIRLSGARLQLDLAEDLPPALADRIQIEQVVLNLVRNALEAMQQTRAMDRLLVVTTAQPAAGVVRARFHDTGCGLPADAASKLFLPFYTTKPGGMGMGLAISRTIVTAHGGRLEAAPGLEGGAEFTFTLPVVASENLS